MPRITRQGKGRLRRVSFFIEESWVLRVARCWKADDFPAQSSWIARAVRRAVAESEEARRAARGVVFESTGRDDGSVQVNGSEVVPAYEAGLTEHPAMEGEGDGRNVDGATSEDGTGTLDGPF